MKFSEVVTQTLAQLQREGRVSYRALKLEFDLSDDGLEALKEEIIEAKRLAIDENGKILVWTGNPGEQEAHREAPTGAATRKPFPPPRTILSPSGPAAERRQLTVMFCDLVGSTALSEQLDPEEWRIIVQEYHRVCTEVTHRFDGHIAQYLGDGLLVYFGYPAAHEDDAQRAARTGLGILAALHDLYKPSLHPMQVRIGIHTGLVVVGQIGEGGKYEQLALGDTPNVAARLQALAEPNTVFMSEATYRLIAGLLDCQDLGLHSMKGISTPIQVYRVLGESGIRRAASMLQSRQG